MSSSGSLSSFLDSRSLPMTDNEDIKKYGSNKATMAIKRWIYRVRMLPRPFQLALAGVICLYLLILGTYQGTSKGNQSSILYNVKHSPRVVQLLDDHVSATPLTSGVLATEGREILERYNPLPHDAPKLKPPSVLDKGDCQPLANWQTGHNPTCNVIHESSDGFSTPLGDTPSLVPDIDEYYDSPVKDHNDHWEQLRYVAGGAFRWVFMIREFDGTRRAMKTLRVDSKNKKFDLRSFDRHRRDAVAMDQLTASPLIVDMYGFCSNSALYDWGEGGDLENIFDREPFVSKEQLLRIAHNVSLSLSHAHHFDEHGRATIAHTDIKPDQFLYQDGFYRLTDFNRVRFLTWNKRRDSECGFRVQKNGGIWRSPEEYAYEIETEKVDVFSLGNVLYFLLARQQPWLDTRSKDVYELVKKRKRPKLPQTATESEHPFDKYMIEAIEMAWTHEAYKRPSALDIAKKLLEGVEVLDRGWKQESEGNN